jgi:hypothetical protein
MCCGAIRKIFNKFLKVFQHGAAVIQQSSVAHQVGTTCWYVLQTHIKIEEYLQVGFKQHPAIMPV